MTPDDIAARVHEQLARRGIRVPPILTNVWASVLWAMVDNASLDVDTLDQVIADALRQGDGR